MRRSLPHFFQKYLSPSTPPPRTLQRRFAPGDDTTKKRVIVIGGGHNGLITSAYLAKNKNLDVLLLERRDLVGGCAVTEEIYPGVKASRASYVAGLLRPRIIEELELEKRRGLTFLPRKTTSFTPCDPEGRDSGKYLRLCDDNDKTHRSISQFSARDADAFAAYEEFVGRCRDVLQPFLDRPIPSELNTRTVRDVAALARELYPLRNDVLPFLHLVTKSASRTLDSWFESDILKATLACDACIGNGAGVDEMGTGYALLHLVMGETSGRKGVWSYVEGGMGAISTAVGEVARERGVEIVTGVEVEEIVVSDGRVGKKKVDGVRLSDGSVVEADAVVSNATPHHTFLELLKDLSALDESTRRALGAQDYSGGCMKINCVTNALPEFTCFPTHGNVGPPHLGTIHFEDSMAQLQTAARDAKIGTNPKRPLIEMAIPTSVDTTLAPQGTHVVQFFVQYTPYHLNDTSKSWDDIKEAYADTVMAQVEKYCPGFTQSIIHRDVLSPRDLERVFGLHEGNIYHGAHGIDQVGFWRPLFGWAGHRCPSVNGLYLCGAGCHPGGGVMGASGRNAATVILSDFQQGFL
eukprot:CAMPEP_0172523314 /NCGR_PEP_ID=MMETSP1066-20121228/293596_1 /TAXON_ID=671091 /ORGANISM="Coscinodiscus wailesii, Strain CCMP2513" /LENGTH=578 /DNA_ID=CAMNT_0013306385 /DNA_START=23 /DNA_END=1759 /DNA_ORIENTATION=+